MDTKYYLHVDEINQRWSVRSREWTETLKEQVTIFNSYNDLLNWVCSNIYEKKFRREVFKSRWSKRPYESDVFDHWDLMRHELIRNFFAKFRHNENDGIWKGGYNSSRTIGYEYKYDEEGKKIASIPIYEYYWIPETFTRHPYQVVDSYGRVINSLDLWKDAILHKWDPYYKERNRKPYICRYRAGTGTGRKNGWWHRYAGNHGGTIGEYRFNIFHLAERNETLKKYGITFNVRGKRVHESMCGCGWDRYHSHGPGRGWKRSRKRKQWM